MKSESTGDGVENIRALSELLRNTGPASGSAPGQRTRSIVRRLLAPLLLAILLAGAPLVSLALGPVKEIDTERDITLNGIDVDDFAGKSVASGDINNDGVDDLIIGAEGAAPGGKFNAGETYVFFGPLSAGTLELSDADITINGVDAADLSGNSVGSGDLNNDGIDDLIIGAPEGDPDGRTGAGEVYVLFGPLAAGTLELSVAADITLNGIDLEDRAGDSVGSGDINNDGVADLIIGAIGGDPGFRSSAGETYVLFGPLAAGTIELSDADVTLNGIDNSDNSGSGVGSGDIDNDGVDDLIIGASRADPGGRSVAGETYVVFGPTLAGTVELSAADITINGVDPFDSSGAGVGSGDLNNDGVDDLIIGARRAAPGGRVNAGETYLLFGPLAAGSLELSDAPDFTFNGIDASDEAGGGVGSGDMNNDGFDDLIIGASGGDPGGRSRAGEAYVLFGPANAVTIIINESIVGLDTPGVFPPVNLPVINESVVGLDTPGVFPPVNLPIINESVLGLDTSGVFPPVDLGAINESLTVTDAISAAALVANTAAGASVGVQPLDDTTATTPVLLTFDTVTQEGTTSLSTSTSGPALPSGFLLGDPPTYFDLTTTALFSGQVVVCIDYTGVSYASELDLAIYHFEDPVWVDRTVSLDTVNNIICASVSSLSPFTVLEPVPPTPIPSLGVWGLLALAGLFAVLLLWRSRRSGTRLR